MFRVPFSLRAGFHIRSAKVDIITGFSDDTLSLYFFSQANQSLFSLTLQ
jgi:hypothetical protein